MDGQRIAKIPLEHNLVGQGLMLVVMALMALGVVMVFSTVGADARETSWYMRRDVRQAMFTVAGLIVLLLMFRMDYHWLIRRGSGRWGWLGCPAAWLLLAGLVLSVVVLVPALGHDVGGQRRWLKLTGPLQVQPSEILKVGVLVFLAYYLSRPDVNPRSFRKGFLVSMALIGLSAGLVVKYNFSTAAVIGLAAISLLLIAGVRWYYLLLVLVLAGLMFTLALQRDPRRAGRVEAMLDPFDLKLQSAYQPRESLIAIGLGGTRAGGMGNGIAKYGYLPEESTDFIFAVICEELRLYGVALVVGLMLLWIWLTRSAMRRAPDRFGALLVGGIGVLIALQAVLHIAVNVVWFPPTGVSLPFVSAGGSSFLVMSAAVAMMVSVTHWRSEAAPTTETLMRAPQPA